MNTEAKDNWKAVDWKPISIPAGNLNERPTRKRNYRPGQDNKVIEKSMKEKKCGPKKPPKK